MKKRYSEITFNDLTFEKGSYTKLTWNGKVLFDDDSEELGGLQRLKEVEKEYLPKIVYSYKVKIVGFHHTELDIKGEE